MHPECVVVVVFAAAAELFFASFVASLMSIYYNLIGVDGGGLGWDAGMVMAGGAWVLMVILNIFLTWWRWTLLQPRQQQRVLQKSKQLLCSEYNVPPISGMVCSCVLCAW